MSDRLFPRTGSARTWFRSIGAGCLTTVLALTAAPVTLAADVSLKISEFRSYLTDEHPVMQGMQQAATGITAASDGAARVEVIAPLLDSPYDILDLLLETEPTSDGPNLVVLPAIGLVPVVPAFELLNLPYLVTSYEQADELLSGPFGNELLTRLEQNGLIGLAWWENGFQHLYSASKPLRTLADFAQLKLRLMPDAGYTGGFESLGATVVNPPFSQVIAMLEQGEIDALDSYISQFFHSNLYAAGGYLNKTGHSYSAQLVVMSRADWETLDSELQALLRDQLPRVAVLQRQASRASEQQAQAAMAEQGVHIVEGSEIAKAELAAALKSQIVTTLTGLDEKMAQLLVEIGYLEMPAKKESN